MPAPVSQSFVRVDRCVPDVVRRGHRLASSAGGTSGSIGWKRSVGGGGVVHR